ncbi:unnamed protein product [Trichobilharzia szidati]|nr:unnamed protein product [Trichobilharzia szidati]
MSIVIADYLRAHFTREAEERLNNIIPTKIRELDDLLKDPMFDLSTGLKRIRLCTDGIISKLTTKLNNNTADSIKSPLQISIISNELMENIYFIVRPFILSLIDDSQILRMWLQMNIPKIEDGNNFGVSVQEEVLLETNKAEVDANAMLDFYGDYLMYRAKIASKVCKWPTIIDYHKALSDADEGAFIRLRINVRDIRNYYGRLYDIYQKNGAKIRAPRNESPGQINIMY